MMAVPNTNEAAVPMAAPTMPNSGAPITPNTNTQVSPRFTIPWAAETHMVQTLPYHSML